jgi:DNA-directed RNA polymerase subunit RPC12/RpoP
MHRLDTEIICHECRASHAEIPYEDDADTPVHCPECGAFLCLWKDVVTGNTYPTLKKA